MRLINRRKTRNFALLNLLFYALTLAINGLGASGFFNGMSQKNISDKYATLITPATFTFGIWGVIYGLLLLTLIYFFIQKNDDEVAQLINKISPYFILSSLLNMGWIVLFSYEALALSTVLIVGLLFSLKLITEKTTKKPRYGRALILPAITFTLYYAWVFIATILNVALYLVKIKWHGFGISDAVWTLIVIALVIMLVVLYTVKRRNALFPLSIAWGFWGIKQAYQGGLIVTALAAQIQWVLIAGLVVFVLAMMITFLRNESLF